MNFGGGDRNSRIKDFFDLHHLASHFEFDRAALVEAVRKTFERRRTTIPAELPIGLSPAYWENPSRPAQVRAFARRAGLAAPTQLGGAFAALLREFLAPLLEELHSGRCARAAGCLVVPGSASRRRKRRVPRDDAQAW